MRYLTVNSKYYCGIDLHKEKMYACIMDRAGKVYLHRNMKTSFETFLLHVEPFLPDLIVGVESMFCYYWLFDKCTEARIPFYLGHAYYMKAVHGGKTKNDRLDSKQIANLMRTNYFPLAYPYPKEMRGTRDLLRRRCRYVYQRGEAYRHIENVFAQQGITDIKLSQLKNQKNRRTLVSRFKEPDLQHLVEADFDFIEFSTEIILKLERQIRKQAKIHDRKAFNVSGHSKAATDGHFKTGHFQGIIAYLSSCTIRRRKNNGKRTENGKANTHPTAFSPRLVLSSD